MKKGELIFFCGKMGAGKTTRSHQMANETNAVLLSEDEWLASLYPNKITSLEEYVYYSSMLKPPIKTLVQSILSAGTNVVMDFPANTVKQRTWFRQILSEVQALHTLMYIDLPNETCLNQIAKRVIDQPERAATDTAVMFEQVTKYFTPPTEEEGFNVTIIR